MAITVLSDVIAPNSLWSAGVQGKNMRRNSRVQVQSGEQQINIIWSRPLRQYTIGSVPLTVTQWQALEGLFEVTEGGAYGFLMEDPKDCTVSDTNGLLYPYTTALVGSIGLGYGVPTYKLYKRYTAAGTTRTKNRAITRPGSIILKRGGVAVTIGVAPGNAAINADTGTITFVADTSQSLSGITPGSTTVLTFSSGTPMVAAMSVGQRVYLSGVTGTIATALNGLSHVITAKGASDLTISTNTTGLTATLFGTAYKYPQASESITWSGRFYVPVHFDNDDLDWELVIAGPTESRFMAGPSVVLSEIRE